MFTAFSFLGSLQSAPLTVEYLIVAGGGAGGIANSSTLSASGGGGAGGYISGSLIFTGSNDATAITYSVSVGSGGSGTGTVGSKGPNGTNSSAFGFTAIGGGGGGGSTSRDGQDGGSGGGAGFSGDFNGGTGGVGTSLQGFAGANAVKVGASDYGGGSGGGAGTTGSLNTAASGSSAGQPKAWLDGNLYAGGGCSCCESEPRDCYGQYTGSGGDGLTADATIPYDAGNGGIFALRYSSSVQHFTGSSQTFESGGYFYHYCSASATPYNLVYLGNYS